MSREGGVRHLTHLRSYGEAWDVISYCGVCTSEGYRVDESVSAVDCLACLRTALAEFMGYHRRKNTDEIVADMAAMLRSGRRRVP